MTNPTDARSALRAQLKAERLRWHASPQAAAAQAELAQRLLDLLQQLEPVVLGLYWPLPGEFDAPGALLGQAALHDAGLALPWAEAGGRMHYRSWNGEVPSLRDPMGIPSCAGAPAEPDVVLVPCLGFTPAGFRLGYGGGYFDRWLAAHPGVTTVGLAWSHGACTFEPAAHDQPLSIVLTEHELLAP